MGVKSKMWAKPNKSELKRIPKLYSTDGVIADKMIYGHFFCGSCDWYIAEYDPETEMFFGYVNLGDDQCAEWGYFSLEELKTLKISFCEVDFDKHWTPRPVKEIPEIVRAGGCF